MRVSIPLLLVAAAALVEACGDAGGVGLPYGGTVFVGVAQGEKTVAEAYFVSTYYGGLDTEPDPFGLEVAADNFGADACAEIVPAEPMTDGPYPAPGYLDVGPSVALLSTVGSFSLSKAVTSTAIRYSLVGSDGLATLGATYDLSISGNGLDSSSALLPAALWMPPRIVVTHPVAFTSGVQIAASAPLDLSWNDDVSNTPMYVLFLSSSRSGIRCRVNDDGAFRVSIANISMVPSAGTLSIYRWRFGWQERYGNRGLVIEGQTVVRTHFTKN